MTKNGYSIPGFINAAMRRSGRTLLVEGTSDYSVLNRLRAERQASSEKNQGVIDSVQIISDENVAGMGNKERIKAINLHIENLGNSSILIRKKLATLVDREWDNIDLETNFTPAWDAPIQGDSSFTTTGHSIENYFFCPETSSQYLKAFYSDDLKHDFYVLFSGRFDQISALASAASLHLKKLGILKKSDGLIDNSCIEWNIDRYHLNSRFLTFLKNRCISTSNSTADEINRITDLLIASKNIQPRCKWLSHGHIGNQILWACIGNLATEYGLPENVSTAIEKGSKERKFLSRADSLSKKSPEERLPLDSVLDWLNG